VYHVTPLAERQATLDELLRGKRPGRSVRPMTSPVTDLRDGRGAWGVPCLHLCRPPR